MGTATVDTDSKMNEICHDANSGKEVVLGGAATLVKLVFIVLFVITRGFRFTTTSRKQKKNIKAIEAKMGEASTGDNDSNPDEIGHDTTSMNIDTARLVLTVLFVNEVVRRDPEGEEDYSSYREPIQRAIDILIQHPSLAYEKYRGYLPLWHFLNAGASAEVVIQAINLNPTALRESSKISKSLPLHLACSWGYPTAVIEAMLDHFPEAIWKQNDFDRTPIQSAVWYYNEGKSNREEIIKVLLERDPDLVTVTLTGQLGPHDLLQLALGLGRGFKTIKHIADCYNHQTTFKVPERQMGIFSEEQVLGLSDLITCRLTKLSCLSRQWAPLASFTLLMEKVAEASKMEELSLALPCFRGTSDESARLAFSQALLNNKTIQTLNLDFWLSNRRSGTTEKWLASLGACLSKKPRITKLILQNMTVAETPLMNFIAGGSAPRGFRLRDCVVEGNKISLDRPSVWEKCRVTNLQLGISRWEERCALKTDLARVLLEKMPHLLILGITSIQQNWNPTDQLVRVITKMPNVRHLVICSPYMDIELICNALKTNTTVETCSITGLLTTHSQSVGLLLDVLENHNSTLKDCEDPSAEDDSEDADKLRYWTNLNRFGRSLVWRRDVRLNLLKRISLLEELIEIKSENDDLNAIFGLLRGSPWILQHEFMAE